MAGSPARDVEPDHDARVPLTAELLVRRYVEQGIAAYQIAAETGWSEHSVRARLRSHGIAVRPPGSIKTRPLDRQSLVDWLEAGLTVREIAERTDYSRSGIYLLLRRWHLSLPKTSPKPAPRGELETVVRLYREEQLSLRDVGAAFGRGPDWARARMLAAGLLLRSRTPGRPRAYPELDTKQVAAWHDAGVTVAQIAVRTGCPRWAVSAALGAAGVSVRGGARSTGNDPDPAAARELYCTQRRTLAQAGRELGCSPDRVAAVLKVAGVALRPPGRPSAAPPLDADLLRELYQHQQLTQQEIADRLGGSAYRISTALTRFGIPRRPRSQRRPVPAFDLDATTMQQLYVTDRLDDTAIGTRYSVPAWRVTVRRRELGIVRPPGAPPHRVPPPAPAVQVLRRLYVEERTPIAVIAQRFGTSTPTARGWLENANVAIRPRTARTHRIRVDPTTLRELYTDREWTAAQIAAELNASQHTVLRALHDNAIPVRRGGTRRTQRLPGEPPTRRLIAALYADRQVSTALRRHQVPRRPQPGPIATRFPTAIALTKALLVELYEGVGLSARQIELLTGQPHQQILDALHANGIDVRRELGFSRWSARQS